MASAENIRINLSADKPDKTPKTMAHKSTYTTQTDSTQPIAWQEIRLLDYQKTTSRIDQQKNMNRAQKKPVFFTGLICWVLGI